MNSTQYENVIEMLKKVLEFYANESNYVQNRVGHQLLSPIEIDNGSQAQYAIGVINELRNTNQKMENDYNKILEEGLSTWGETTNLEDIAQIIKDNTKHNDNNI